VDERKALKSLLEMQTPNDFLWTRDRFIENSALREFNTIFIAGHTPTPTIDGYENIPQIVRIDNKFLIDCGVYHFGVLGALQLIDNEVIAHYCSVEKGYYSQSLGNLR